MIRVLHAETPEQTIEVDGVSSTARVVTLYIDSDDAIRLAQHRADRLPSDPLADESREISIPVMDALIAGGVI